MTSNIDKAIAILRKNIATVPPHGCQRDEVLALLLAETLPREGHNNGC